MEKYGTVQLTETQNFCFKIPETRNITKALERPKDEPDFLIINSLRESITTDADQKLYDNFLTGYDDFKRGWKKWIDDKTNGLQMEFQEIGGNRFNIGPSKIDLNLEILKDRGILRAPGLVLSDLRNKCFPGVNVIYQLRQDKGYLVPSEEFRNSFLEKMGVSPDENMTIERPSFDKMPGVEGSFKSKIEGAYFEVENKKGGKITAFFDVPTLMKIVG